MSKPPQKIGKPPQKSKNKKQEEKPALFNPVAWIVRVAVGVVLVVLVTLTWHEFQVQQAFAATNEAWQKALRSKAEDADLTKSEFSRIPVKGTPTITSDKAGPNTMMAITVETFTWKGRLRSYSVKVYFGLGSDPPVEQIEVVQSGT